MPIYVSLNHKGQVLVACLDERNGELAIVPCPKDSPPASAPMQLGQGIGSAIASLTSAAGVTPCGACKRRAAFLNRWTPPALYPLVARVAGFLLPFVRWLAVIRRGR